MISIMFWYKPETKNAAYFLFQAKYFLFLIIIGIIETKVNSCILCPVLSRYTAFCLCQSKHTVLHYMLSVCSCCHFDLLNFT